MSSGLKSFVTEAEVDNIKKKRQEEWERVRKPDDPLERPEEELDNRTLYERLQEQKEKKQEEWEEQHKLKNLIRGLDNDETTFLDLVSRQQAEMDSRRFTEDTLEMKNYRNAVSELHGTILEQKVTESSTQRTVNKPAAVNPGKKSQQQLIAGAIKRRKSSGSCDGVQEKKLKTIIASEEQQTEQKECATMNKIHQPDTLVPLSLVSGEDESTGSSSQEQISDKHSLLEVIKEENSKLVALSGLVQYYDSSDSERDSENDSESIAHI